MYPTAATQLGLRALWAARAVAVVGASSKPDSPGHLAVQFLTGYGYRGRILPINPTAPAIAGVPAFPSIGAAGGADLALIVTPAAAVEAAIDDCAEAGVSVAIVGSSGFAETGPVGRARQEALAARAAAAGIRLVGPNCIGAVGFETGLVASFSPLFSGVDTRLIPGGVGFASASGALGYGVVSLALQRGLGLFAAVSTGNEADVTALDALVAMAGEPECTALLGYLESLHQVERLRELAACGKPVALLVAGRSAAGARAAASHTGALTTPSRVIDGALKQLGVAQAYDLDELLDYAEAFSTVGRLAGDRVAIVTTSGGSGILAADAVAAQGLRLAELSDETTAELAGIVPDFGAIANPVDVTATVMRDRTLVARALSAVSADPAVDVIVLCFCVLVGADVDAIVASLTGLAKPILAVRTGAEHLAPQAAAAFRAAGVPVFTTPGQAIRAVAALRCAGRPVHAPARAAAAPPGGTTERVVKDWLAAHGLAVPAGRLVTDPVDAPAAVGACGGLAVLKSSGPALTHKTDLGAVALDVVAQAARETAMRLLEVAGATGVLVEQQIPPGLELLVGVAPTALGQALTVGAGGVDTERLDDIAVRLLPVRPADIEEQLAELRIARLFPAARGRPGVDLAALVRFISKFASAAAALPVGASLEANPVRLTAAGPVILDAVYLPEEA